MNTTRTGAQTQKGIVASLALALLGALLLTFVPAASAHECAAHEGCDASDCPDGENHAHTDYNDDTEDEYCKSSADAGDGTCRYPVEDVKLPPAVCEILGYRLRA